MPTFQTTRLVGHTPLEMFDLVADVEKYPQFLPLCLDMRVRRRQSGKDGEEIIIAEMQVGYRAIRERFTSRVNLDRAGLKILVEYIDGPFRTLHNRWQFLAVGEDACRVEFFITYEFASRTLALLMGAMFDRAFRKFAEAFEQRADFVYGQRRRIS
jgi:coenzyme Q-binding protein COQ10